MAKATQKNIQTRPPVVVILGHVDHGKTTLLDYIRQSHVAEKETGGITQHIGAYEITHQDKKITFIDTPGHEAFSAMRSRGAKVADIAVLVVAAEEGIGPQTKEAVLQIKKIGLPVIVAINKMDKSEANPEKVKRQLSEVGLLAESLGGKVPSVEVSAKTGQGVNELLELILLIGEMEGLKGDTGKAGQGLVVEACLDSQRGPTATLLLRDGLLKRGDIVGTPSVFGKVKILEDFRGKSLDIALPSMPCIVIGLEKVPQVGEKFEVYPDVESAQKYIEKKERKTEKGEVFLIEEGKKVFNLILKADVQGSLGAIAQVLRSIPQEKVILRVLEEGVGEISEQDVKLAKSGQAQIIGFRVKTNPTAAILAERDHIRIMTFYIIYELVQAIRDRMLKMTAPEKVRMDLGQMKILAIFLREKNRQIAGGRVIKGEIKKGASVDVSREGVLVGKGKIINLQKNKKDVTELGKGEECGILYEGEAALQESDILEIYETQSKGQSID